MPTLRLGLSHYSTRMWVTGSRQTQLQVSCEGHVCFLVGTDRESCTQLGDCQDSGFVAMHIHMSYV